MTKNAPIFSFVRGARAAVLAALVIGHSSLVIAATPSASVVAVHPTSVADIILLDHGFDASLRPGMVCRLTRGTTEIAEVVLVELRPSCSAALIVNLAPKQSIRAGDVATIKILKS